MIWLYTLLACAADPGEGSADDTGTVAETCAPTIGQGVYGQVLWREGNHAPGTGDAGGDEWPLDTAVALWPPLGTANLVATDDDQPEVYGHYDVLIEPSAHTTTDTDGCYELGWSPGSVSILAADAEAWFCNAFDKHGACVVEVLATSVTRFDIVVDYAAAY